MIHKYQMPNIKCQIQKYLLLLIILLAGFLRLYQLGQNPPSLDWDEASLGYNAYSILKTGKDEFGRFLPVSIRSFEDYKPAAYTYLTIPFVYVFGLNEFAVRFPSALFGTMTVVIVFFLVKVLFKDHRIAYLSAFLLAISPWHLQFSRVAFEANIGLFFVTAGILFFLKGLKKGNWFILSAILFVISLYSYHSPRLIVPLLLFGWAIYYWKEIWQKRIYIILAIVLGSLMLVPFMQEMFRQGRARLSSVTVLTPEGRLEESIEDINYDISRHDYIGKLLHNRRIIYLTAVTKGYLDHFNLDFLFLTGDTPNRHHALDMGMLYLWDAIFIFFGIMKLLKKRWTFPLFWWFLVAPIASAITTGTPHAVRALYYLPIYQIFTAYGVFWCLNYFKNLKHLKVLLTVLLIINVAFYLEMYYVHTPVEAAKDWQYGYKEAVLAAKNYESGINKIILTYFYDQPHIFVLFYDKIDPVWYQKQYHGEEIQRSERSFGKYEFRRIDWEKDKNMTSVLLIGSPEEIPETAEGIVKTIYYPNGQVAFRVVKR